MGIGLSPFIRSLLFDYTMLLNRPALIDYQSVSAIHQLKTQNANITLVNDPSVANRKLLKLELLPGKYPGLYIDKFVSDWHSYKHLNLEVYNPLTSDFSVVLRIHDAKHRESGNAVSDRFNRHITLRPGWNSIKQTLSDVRNAPSSRQMNMQQIAGLMLFSIDVRKTIILNVGEIALEK